MDLYFVSIESKLSFYENLKDAPILLELAIWKYNITERLERNDETLTVDMKMECRTDSVTMVTIVVPNVLSFLTHAVDGSVIA